MKLVDLVIETQDGFPLRATQYIPDEVKANLVIAAGLGIPRHFYKHIAAFAASRGYQTTTFDYRGIHESQHPDFSGRDMKFSHWGERDLHAVLGHIKGSSSLPLSYLAHSAGGQILGMSSYAQDVAAASFLGSVIPDSKNYSGLSNKIGLKLLWWFLLPALSLVGDEAPASKLGLSTIDVPTGVLKEWSSWGRSRRYLFDDKHQLDLTHYAKVTCPVRVIAIDDDNFAPLASCEDLGKQYTYAKRSTHQLDPQDHGFDKLGHFGYFRRPAETLWVELFDWYDAQLN